jgi:hypothetical protein
MAKTGSSASIPPLRRRPVAGCSAPAISNDARMVLDAKGEGLAKKKRWCTCLLPWHRLTGAALYAPASQHQQLPPIQAAPPRSPARRPAQRGFRLGGIIQVESCPGQLKQILQLVWGAPGETCIVHSAALPSLAQPTPDARPAPLHQRPWSKCDRSTGLAGRQYGAWTRPCNPATPSLKTHGRKTWSTLTASIALAEMSTPLRARTPRSKRTCTARTARGQRRALHVWSLVRCSALAGASRYQMRLAPRLRRGSCVEETARRRVQNLGAVLALSQERRKLHETRHSATLRATDTQHALDYTRNLGLVAGTDPRRSPPATIPAGRAPCTEARTGAD